MMRRRGVLVSLAGPAAAGAVLLGIPGAAGAWAVPAGAVRAAGAWGKAIGVPGLGVLNKDENAKVVSVACTSAGNCAAGGYYRDQHRHLQGFVAAERRGRWDRAAGIPGLPVLNKGGNAGVVSMSCTSAGNCTAAGNYQAGGHSRGFIVSEKNGRWGRAAEVPGLGALVPGAGAVIKSMSCGSAGSCAAAGNYSDSDGHLQGFTVSENNGTWGQAAEVPGLGALNQGGNAGVSEVSCASAGSCAAAGNYSDSEGHQQGFTVSEKKGIWGQAVEVPGLGALNQGGNARVLSVSCASAGSCAAGGDYFDSSGFEQGFVTDENKGTWGQAIEAPGLGALNGDSDASLAYVGSVSCASPGNCTAGGAYGWPYSWAFVISEKNGTWGQATNVPGLGALVGGRWAYVGSVSCASPGNCAVGGDYEDIPGTTTGVFVILQRNGTWGQATNVPGLRSLNKKVNADLSSVSCGSPGHCAAAGNYFDRHHHLQGYVTQG